MPSELANWFYMETSKNTPQSTTHEMLEMGIAKRAICKASNRKKINYQKFGFDEVNTEKAIKMPLMSSYKSDYAAPYENICLEKVVNETAPHNLFNRKPVNDFALERLTSSEFKFMDDHLTNVSAERQKINFFRQIRNQHYTLV